MMGLSRNRSAGAKVTEEEYAELQMLARARGLTLGEWCREILLSQLQPPTAATIEETLLAEVLGLRMIVINLLRDFSTGEVLTGTKVQKIIQWADQEKVAGAKERLKEAAKKQP